MSYYCTRSSRARVERVSSASRARASVNLWVDGTVPVSPAQITCTSPANFPSAVNCLLSLELQTTLLQWNTEHLYLVFYFFCCPPRLLWCVGFAPGSVLVSSLSVVVLVRTSESVELF